MIKEKNKKKSKFTSEGVIKMKLLCVVLGRLPQVYTTMTIYDQYMALELAAPGMGIGHAASSWIRWAEKCISGRRCTVKLRFPECVHNHLRRRIAFKFLPWLAFVFSFPVSKMCQSGKAMLDINSLELSSPSTAVCSEKCKQQAWLKQLCLSPWDISRETSTYMSCTCTRSFRWRMND